MSSLANELETRSDLNGKLAFVTGGGAGIGAAIVQELSRRGAFVLVADIDETALDSFNKNDLIKTIVCDVGDARQVASAFAELEVDNGRLDILVNNTGVAGPTASPDAISIEDWDRTISINLSSMFYCVRHALPLLRRQGGGAIVNISSAAIRRGGFPMRLPYATSKSAVIGFTQTLAMDVGCHGIRVNCVLPGTVEGERVDAVLSARSNVTGIPLHELKDQVMQATSLRTNVMPTDLAKMVAFLCSDDARYVSGQTISVCGNFEGHRSSEVVQ